MNKMMKGYEDENGLHVYCPKRAQIEKLKAEPANRIEAFCYTPRRLLQLCPKCNSFESCPIRNIVERIKEEEKEDE